MILVFCMLSHGALHLCEISWKYLKLFSIYRTARVQGGNGYVQCSKGNNSKSRQTRVTVFCVLHVVSCCFTFVWSFMKISRTVSVLWSGHENMVEMAMLNVQRIITPKVGKPEIQFMCSMCLYLIKYQNHLHMCRPCPKHLQSLKLISPVADTR